MTQKWIINSQRFSAPGVRNMEIGQDFDFCVFSLSFPQQRARRYQRHILAELAHYYTGWGRVRCVIIFKHGQSMRPVQTSSYKHR